MKISGRRLRWRGPCPARRDPGDRPQEYKAASAFPRLAAGGGRRSRRCPPGAHPTLADERLGIEYAAADPDVPALAGKSNRNVAEPGLPHDHIVEGHRRELPLWPK